MIKKIDITFVLIIIVIALPSYSAGFSLDFSIGFNGQFQLNNWTPLSVVLDNRGRIIRGKLEVLVTSGSEYRGDVYRTLYTTEVDLPQNSKKRYAFTIKIESFAHELIIRLKQDDDIIFSKSINLRSHFTEKNFAVVADNFIAPDILSVLPKDLYPTNVRPKFLPETWYGYNSVDLLIMRTDTIRQLRDRQFQALTRWLKQGGYLVLGTGLNYGSLADKRLQDILPIRASGHQQFFELKALGPFCSRELTGTEPFLVLKARIADSKILLKENDIPLIMQKRLGFGQIVFLSFDFYTPPFNRWDGRRMFWDKILSLQPKIDRPKIDVADQLIVNSMFSGMPLEFPRFRSVVMFVGAYLISLWFFLKRIQKPDNGRRRYSLYLLVTIVLFTSIGYWGFYYPKLKQKFIYNSFCQIDLAGPRSPALARYFIGLYSLTKLEYSLNFGSYAYPVDHIISEKSDTQIPNPYVLQKKDGGQHIAGSIQRWSHNFYKLNLHFRSPLAGHARRDKSFMTLMVENNLPHNIVDCLVYYQKRFLWVEDILAGTQQAIKFSLARLKKEEFFGEQEIGKIIRRFGDNGSASYLRKTQRNLSSDLLLEIHAKYKTRPDNLILIGWLEADLIQPEFNPAGPPGVAISMISWELPVELAL
jgi:hypothetical protein